MPRGKGKEGGILIVHGKKEKWKKREAKRKKGPGRLSEGSPHRHGGLVARPPVPPVRPLGIFVLLGLLAWSMVKMIVTVIVQAYTIYRERVAGLRLLGAFWSLSFQLIITLVRWANKAATEMADQVTVEMECQANHNEDRRVPTGKPNLHAVRNERR
jgi:hypothetical protein